MLKILKSTIFFQGFGYFFQFSAFVLFAKMLGPENQGMLSIFRASGQIISLLIWLGLPTGIIYFVGKDKNLFLPSISNCFKLFTITFSIFIVTFYILPIDTLPKLLLIKGYRLYLFVFVFSLSLFTMLQLSVLSLRKYIHYNLFNFGAGVFIIVFAVLIYIMPGIYEKLKYAIVAYVATYVLMVIYGAGLILQEKRNIDIRVRKLAFREQFWVGFRGYVSSFGALLLFRLDLFLVAYFLTFEEVGIYSIALFSAEMVTKIPVWSASILTPMVASNETGHVKRTVYLFYSAIIVALLLGLFFVLGIMTFPTSISNLIGKDFTGVEICLLLLLPRVIMQSGVGILAANLAGKGYPWYHPAGCTIPIIFLVLLDIVLIPRLGINGAALGNSLAFVSAAIIFWIGFRKYNELTEDVRFKAYWREIRGYLHGCQ